MRELRDRSANAPSLQRMWPRSDETEVHRHSYYC